VAGNLLDFFVPEDGGDTFMRITRTYIPEDIQNKATVPNELEN
jgi:hypothetical protein